MLEAKQIYEETVSKAKQIYHAKLAMTHDAILEIDDMTERIRAFLEKDGKELLVFCLADYPVKNDYLYYHIANVLVFSLLVGAAMNYEQSRLNDIGIAAFLHDVGIINYLELINKERTLSVEEYGNIKKHPDIGSRILNGLGGLLSRNVIEAVRQEHERMDGSGYPLGIKDEQIIEEAKVIGFVDVYEALMHQRPYRDKFTPLDAMKTILSSKFLFDQTVVKIIIEKIGIFPVGTIVRLNTREIGLVFKGNQRLPLRPVVKVAFDAMGKKLVQTKDIDLAANSMIYIEESLNELPGKRS